MSWTLSFHFILERKMNQASNSIENSGAASTKPEQIINNADGTSTVIFPEGTASESTPNPVIRQFSKPDGNGMLLEQTVNFNTGGSEVFIDNPTVLAQLGKIGAVFGDGDVASQLASIDIKFTGANGTGDPTSGQVKTNDGETYAFKVGGPEQGELVSVQEFSGPGQEGKIEQTIGVFSDGSVRINMMSGSGLPNGVTAMQENFNSNGNLATERTQFTDGTVTVKALNYDASGKEVSQTVETFNRQNQVVSSVTSAPSGPTPPQIGGQQAIDSIVAALSSLNLPAPGSSVATAGIQQPHKMMLAGGAH